MAWAQYLLVFVLNVLDRRADTGKIPFIHNVPLRAMQTEALTARHAGPNAPQQQALHVNLTRSIGKPVSSGHQLGVL